MLQAFLQQSAKLRGPWEMFYSVNAKFSPRLTHKLRLCPIFQLLCAFSYSVGWYCSRELWKGKLKVSISYWALNVPIVELPFKCLWRWIAHGKITLFIFFYALPHYLVENTTNFKYVWTLNMLSLIHHSDGLAFKDPCLCYKQTQSSRVVSSHLISCARASRTSSPCHPHKQRCSLRLMKWKPPTNLWLLSMFARILNAPQVLAKLSGFNLLHRLFTSCDVIVHYTTIIFT